MSEDINDFINFEDEPGDTESYGQAFLLDLGRLIERYGIEYDVDYLYLIGCLDLQKRVLLDALIAASEELDDDDTDEDFSL